MSEYQYGKNSNHSNNNSGGGNGDLGSWILIGAMFLFGLWPIGLFLLISKLSDSGRRRPASQSGSASASAAKQPTAVKRAVQNVTKTPQYSDKGSRIMRIVGIVLAIIGCLAILGELGNYSPSFYLSYPQYILEDFSYPLGMLTGGVGLMLGSRGMRKRERRFAKYLAVAGSDQAISLQRLARAAEVSEKKLEKDLEIMVEKGLWGPEAYVDGGAGMLFRTRAAAAQYEARTTQAQPTPAEAAQGYSGALRQIRAANDRIADPVLSAKIDRLEEIAGRIFRIIETEPAKKAKAAKFLNYYLPTTQKLLDNYAEFEEAGVSGENLGQAKAKIEQTMDNIVSGFERQLDELFQSDAMDIDSDIRVMETMLKRDSASVSDDFGLGGSAAAGMEESGE
jgi:hypothetical protein